MSAIQFLRGLLRERAKQPGLIWRDRSVEYGQLLAAVDTAKAELAAAEIPPGASVVLCADYSPNSVAWLLALIEANVTIVPLLPRTIESSPSLTARVGPVATVSFDSDDRVKVTPEQPTIQPALLTELGRRGTPGLVLFTSGSTGEPKGVVHDFAKLITKFKQPRPPMTTLNFLLFDHWGGLNTLLHCLSSGSLTVLPENRSVEHILDLMIRHDVELLPASPSFLNLMLLSGAYRNRSLPSLKVISYGAEPMPETTLRALRAAFPGVELRQTYGLIELGVLRAKSKSSDSLLVKIGGTGYDVRVVDGLLEIKSDTAMLGYLNAPNPFTEDGYFRTGDRVEIEGEYLRILGRESDLINVGGEKVYPAEVESVLLDCPGVADAVVFGESNPLVGAIVCAKLIAKPGHLPQELRHAAKRYCLEYLDKFKVPVKISVVEHSLQSDRMKRFRRRPG